MTASFVDLRHLRYVLAAIDHGSFRKAAVRLGVRESAVSRRIRDLEGHLGITLFVRHPSGVRPTGAGRRFGGRAADIVRALGTAVEEVGAFQPERDGTGRSDMPFASPESGSPRRPRIDRAVAFGEAVFRLMEMLESEQEP